MIENARYLVVAERRLPDGSEKFATNILHFARALRRAGLPIGTGRVIDALSAVEFVGLRSREEFYWALHGLFVSRPEQRLIFNQGFYIFWKRPGLLDQLLNLNLTIPSTSADVEPTTPGSRRLGEAMGLAQIGVEAMPSTDTNKSFGASYREVLRKRDFEKMSTAEIDDAKRIIKRLALPVAQRPTRRFAVDQRGTFVDARASIRASLRLGGGIIQVRYRRRRWRSPPLVVICDISGSMSRYSRLLLHFIHVLANDRDQVHAFVFGTRLTNITRYLQHRDADVALDNALEAVSDWSGGTRIGACLHNFNHDWSRRVLSQGAVTILITDGLDRDAGNRLDKEMERLHKSCRRLIWLNPLLRYAGFEAKSLGVRAMLPHVDDFRPAHDLESIAALAETLAADGPKCRSLTMESKED